MNPYFRAHQLRTREDFVAFVESLARSYREHPDEWENGDVPAYLGAIARWTAAMHGAMPYDVRGVPEQPTWSILGQILLAARSYE